MSRAAFPGLLIIADDLSGAADCAADFSRRIDTHVLLDSDVNVTASVLAIDLDSRRLSAPDAAQCQHEALQNPAFAHKALYKKIDSTLRGNVASEVAALQAVRGMALIAPAFPAMQRTTRAGMQWLAETPVDQSDVWLNEHLSGTSDLRVMMAEQGLKTRGLNLQVMRDPATLAQELRHALADGVQALVCDAEQEGDLHNLAQASAALHEQLFWVGSAGLARHLPAAFGLPEPQPLTIEPASPVLIVVGSMSRHSQAQADQLAAASGAFCLELAPALLLDATAESERCTAFQTVVSHLSAGRDVLIRLDQHHRDPAQAALLSDALAQWLAPALPHIRSLIATGGETARALLLAADINQLALHGELATGVVLSRAIHRGRPLNIVTKAGGFGQPDTLLSAWRLLRHAVIPVTEEASHV